MKTKKQGNNWTAYYDPDTNRYFAEIMYTSREGREQYDYEMTGLEPLVMMWRMKGLSRPARALIHLRIQCMVLWDLKEWSGMKRQMKL